MTKQQQHRAKTKFMEASTTQTARKLTWAVLEKLLVLEMVKD